MRALQARIDGAVEKGDHKEFQRLVSKRSLPSIRSSQKLRITHSQKGREIVLSEVTLLHVAVYHCALDLVVSLLVSDPNLLNEKDKQVGFFRTNDPSTEFPPPV